MKFLGVTIALALICLVLVELPWPPRPGTTPVAPAAPAPAPTIAAPAQPSLDTLDAAAQALLTAPPPADAAPADSLAPAPDGDHRPSPNPDRNAATVAATPAPTPLTVEPQDDELARVPPLQPSSVFRTVPLPALGGMNDETLPAVTPAPATPPLPARPAAAATKPAHPGAPPPATITFLDQLRNPLQTLTVAAEPTAVPLELRLQAAYLEVGAAPGAAIELEIGGQRRDLTSGTWPLGELPLNSPAHVRVVFKEEQ